MSRHEGVSCDSCLKGNFFGRRYKCLTCYDYDLCASCYESGASSPRHTTEHPMQCILTRSDFELYYKGEGLTPEQSQSFTCPFCGRMGFTETALQEHVNSEHPDSNVEVVCPVCAAQPGGDPNLVIEDFAGHLALEHRPTSRDLISFLDEPTGTRPSVRRLPHTTRAIGTSRPRRTNLHFSSGGISSLSPSGRDAVDPIAELLSQLSGVRRNNPAQGSASAQLQQLQMQLQLERQQVRAARQHLERLPRRQVHTTSATAMTSGSTSTAVSTINHVLTVSSAGGGTSTPKTNETASNNSASIHGQAHPQLMLTKCMDTSLTETELENLETERADRSLFLQDLLLNTLMISSEEDYKSESKQPVRERTSPPHVPLQSSPPPTAPQYAITQTSATVTERPRSGGSSGANSSGQTHELPTVTKRNHRLSLNTDRSSGVLQQRSNATLPPQQQQNRGGNIEYLLTARPQQPSSDGSMSVREVYYGNTDTTRRKPICTVDSINQATEPPTSH